MWANQLVMSGLGKSERAVWVIDSAQTTVGTYPLHRADALHQAPPAVGRCSCQTLVISDD